MIKQEIEKYINMASQKMGLESKLSVSFSSLPAICDFQCNDSFALAKKLSKNPLQVAEEIVASLPKNDDYIVEAVKPAFINIKLTDKKIEEIANSVLKDENLGVEKHEKSKKIILDYGGANVAKELHVGHLRSPIIGESLKRLYKLLGDEVISDVHLGDWGLQMGLTELELFEEGYLDYYFKNQGEKPVLTLDMLNTAYPKASIKKKEDPSFKTKADEWTLNIQHKKEPFYTIYKEIKKVSIEQIKKNYEELGANFDLWFGESDAESYIDKALKIFEDKGLSKESDGATIVEIAREGEHIPIPKKSPDEPQLYKNPMPPAILKKYNGGVMYVTTDIATIYMRNKDHAPDEIHYIVDGRQDMHFNQVFRCCKLAGISPENQVLLHLGYGTMNGKDGKPFKTRAGDTIKLADIINLLIEKASEKLASNGVPVTRELALKIGVGAMKFGDLLNVISKDYVFDIDKFLAFEGKTGPYIQYTVARINSILSKVEKANGKIVIEDLSERNIILALIKLIASYEVCYNDHSLNALCLACYDLASAYATFYNNHRIVSEEDLKRKESYISLSVLVRDSLIQALNVLAIEIPEKM